MTALNSTMHDIWDSHFWGPVTATLDWCEANYQFTRYIAETANTFSNLFTVGLACYGGACVRAAKLPPRYFVGWLGFAFVGIGSFIFHATLRYSAQLADELPMVLVASYCAAVLFDTQPGFGIKNTKSVAIIVSLIAFNIIFTWSYALYRDPVFHQVVFATIMFINIFRTWYILSNSSPNPVSPAQYRISTKDRQRVASLFTTGAATFAFGFFVWNLDNIFCTTVTRWKHHVGWPAAFALEGHSWWHILTALGTYLMLIGNSYLTLGIKDNFDNYAVVSKFGMLPVVIRPGGRKGSLPKKEAKSQ